MDLLDRFTARFSISRTPPRIYLDPEEARREHMRRVRRHHVLEIPCLRAFGLIMIAVFVLLHNLYVVPTASAWTDFWRLLIIYILYIAVSWVILLLCFGKVQKVHLGLFFLLFDIVFFIMAIYYSGGEKSWLFFLLMVRTADQARTTWRNTLLFAHASTLGYVLMLAYLVYFQQRTLSLPAELTIVCFIYASNIYLLFVSRTAEYLRNRMTAAVRLSRDLIRQLEAQSNALQVSERDYRALVEGSIQGIVIHQQGIIQLANPALARIFGYESPDVLVGLDYSTLVAQQERDRLEGFRAAFLEGLPTPECFEFMGVRKDRTSVWIECLVSHITWRGAPATLSTLQDITARREAEEALQRAHVKLEARVQERTAALQQANEALRIEIAERQRTEAEQRLSEKSYRLLVKNIPGVVYRGDADGGAQFFDDKIQALTGCPVEDFASGNLKWPALIHPEDLASAKRAFVQALRGDKEYIREYRIKRQDGHYQWVQDRGQIVCDEDGRIDYMSGVLFDITERKRMQEEKEKLDVQVRQAQKMEAVGRLAGGVAHDFNNMLSVILGYIELVVARLKPFDPIYDDLKAVQAAANRSADLTRQLLAFSRKQTIAPRPVNLNEQMKGMERLLARIIGEDIELVFNLSAELWPLYMDPAQVDQIVANLAVNSRDAMPKGGKLTVETANTTIDEKYCANHPGVTPGDFVMLAVKDTGFGMDKETLEHVFEPFFTTKGEGKGTGLGLAMIYGIAEQNDGFVDIYSEPDQGTTVQVYIPRYMGEEATLAATAEEGRPKGRGEAILLVEDEDQVRQLAKTMLERLGYRVLDAPGPGEAIALCEKYSGEIDLLLTDVVMPNMNGVELEERITAMKPGVRTLFMSGYAANAMPPRGVLKKGAHFLQKPFSLNSLAREVRAVLAAQL